MAEGRPIVMVVPPGGAGVIAALRDLVDDKTVITAMEDGALATARNALGELEVEEYLPFGNCIGRFAAMCGDSGLPRLTGTQSIHLVQRAVITLMDSNLKLAKYSRGGAASLSRTLTELRHHRIGPEELGIAAESTTDPVSARRFHELSVFAEEFYKLCSENGREVASERAEFCLSQTDPPPFVIKRLIVILGGPRVPLFDEWLNWLSRHGVQVICLMQAWMDCPGAYEPELAWASALGEIVDRTETYASTERWTKAIFEGKKAPLPSVEVSVLEAGDDMSQCEWVVRKIQKLRLSGTEYRSIGIFIRGGGTLVNVLSVVAERLGLQISGLKSMPLTSNGFVCFCMHLLRTMQSGDLSEFSKLLGSSYFGLSEGAIRALIDDVSHQDVAREDAWIAFAIAAGKSRETAWIGALTSWRILAVESQKSLRDWAELFHQIWAKTPILDRSIDGPDDIQQRDFKAWTLMQRTLRDAALSSDSSELLPFDEFVQRSIDLWRQEQILWEDRHSQIKLCTNLNQLEGFDHLFCLNMIEGTIPARRKQDPVLDDTDRRCLAEALPHSHALPSSSEVAAAERSTFITLCAGARTSLTFSYALASEDQDYVRSFYLDDLQKVFGIDPETHPRTEFAPSAMEQCESFADRELREALDSDPKSFPTIPCVEHPEILALTQREEGQDISLSEIVAARFCAFRSVFHHVVQFRPPKNTLSRDVLRSLPRLSDLISARSVSEAKERLRAEALQHAESLRLLPAWEQRLYNSAFERSIEGWVDREFVSREKLRLSEATVHKNVSIEDLRGKKVKLGEFCVRFKVDALYELPDRRIGFVYGRYSFSDSRFYDPEPYFWGDLAVILLQKLGESPVTIMVDSGEVNRIAYSSQWLPVKSAHIQQKVAEFHKDPKKQLREEFKSARDNLLAGTAVPTNGRSWCKRCDLGDLCRNHAEFGEGKVLP